MSDWRLASLRYAASLGLGRNRQTPIRIDEGRKLTAVVRLLNGETAEEGYSQD